MLVYRFLKHLSQMYARDPPIHTLYCYGIDQPLIKRMEREFTRFEIKQGLPTSEELEDYTKERKHKLIIIDDLMQEVIGNQEMELLFTRCVSVILITQNLFPQSKHARTNALNTWFTVLMKNVRDVSQVGVLGRQLFPGRVKGFLQAYKDGLTEGYFVLNMSPHADDRYR